MLPALRQRFLHAVFFADIPLAQELDFDARPRPPPVPRSRATGRGTAPRIAGSRKSAPSRSFRYEVIPAGVADLRQSTEDQHRTSNSALPQSELNTARSEAQCPLGNDNQRPVWFRLCRFRQVECRVADWFSFFVRTCRLKMTGAFVQLHSCTVSQRFFADFQSRPLKIKH